MGSYSIEPYGLSRKRLKPSIQSGRGDLSFQSSTDHAFRMAEDPFDYPVDISSKGNPLHFDSQMTGLLSIMSSYGYIKHSSLEASGSSDTLPTRAVSVPALNPSTWSPSLQQNFVPSQSLPGTVKATSSASYSSYMMQSWPLSPSQDPGPQQAAQVLATMAATSVDRPDQITTINNSQSSLNLPNPTKDLDARRLMSFQRNQAQDISWTSFTDPLANRCPENAQAHISPCTAEAIFPCLTECDEDDCSSICSEPGLCETGCADACNVGTGCSDPCIETFCKDATCLEGVEELEDKSSCSPASRGAYLSSDLSYSTNAQCLWVSDNEYCMTMLPSSGALEHHVFKDHIEPQTAQICPYECGATIYRGEIIQHMSREHAYMCFEYGCDFQSTDCEHLHQHVKSAHSRSSNTECHWDECSVTAVDSNELNGHVIAEHLTIPSLTEATVHTNIVSSPTKVCELPSSVRDEEENLHSPITDPKRWSLTVFPTPSSDDGKRVCHWIAHEDPTNVCGMGFEKPNDLQDHVERTHIQPLTGPEAKLCKWKGCSKTNQPFKHKAKLKVHLRSHTGCTDY